MTALSELADEELLALSDLEFREQVQNEARLLAPQALETYQEVMTGAEDDRARVAAADKILLLAGVSDRQNALPVGVTAEVFASALAGLGKIVGIANVSDASASILRNVTPAKADPRMLIELPDDSPFNRTENLEPDDNEDIINALGQK